MTQFGALEHGFDSKRSLTLLTSAIGAAALASSAYMINRIWSIEQEMEDQPDFELLLNQKKAELEKFQ